MLYVLYGTERLLMDQRLDKLKKDHHCNQERMNYTVYDVSKEGMKVVLEDVMTPPFLSDEKMVVIKKADFLTTKKIKKDNHDIDYFMQCLPYLDKTVHLVIFNDEKNFDERNMVYFFTKKGMIKKTSLKEYDGNYSIWQAYKFKYENDEVISVCIEDYSESEVLIISKKGMAIRFLSDNVNPMGRIAAGVTGISLKEDDEVIYGKIIDITSNNSDEIAVDTSRSFEVVLITSSKEKKTISTEEIRIQNRAGRGTNVMVISLDDEITEVQFS